MQHSFRFRESIGEIAGGLFLLALGVVWAVTSTDYGLIGEGGRLAPGTVPFTAGVILALCGAVIVAKGIISGRVPAGGPEREAEVDGTASAVNAAGVAPPVTERKAVATRVRSFPQDHPVLSVYGLVLIGVLIMPITGFSIAFALAIFAILRLVERQRIRTAAAIAVVTALFGYLLFEVVFNLPLPEPFFL
ncbi:MAG: tripartite tricarboxylate transporter TctB family protein [Homoserinimonas sp.]